MFLDSNDDDLNFWIFYKDEHGEFFHDEEFGWLNFNINTFTFTGTAALELVDQIVEIQFVVGDNHLNISETFKIDLHDEPPTVDPFALSLSDQFAMQVPNP